MLLLPWHLSDHLPEGLGVTLPGNTVEIEGCRATTGDPWRDLIGVYAPLADEVARESGPTVVVSGDCVACLAVLAGVQRRGVWPSLIWFDAHGDFHTEESTTSGYLGGLPLAKAVGRGDMTLPDALGLSPLGEDSVTLVDARDLDPAEVVALAGSEVRLVPVSELDTGDLPDGPVVVHVDVDVIDPDELMGLRFPASGGPHLDEIVEAVHAVVRDKTLVALDIAATWRPRDTDRTQADAVVSGLLSTFGSTP